MSRISRFVIADIRKILNKQFHIDIWVENNKYCFKNLKNQEIYNSNNGVIYYPHDRFRGEERSYISPSGKKIRCIEESYISGLGTLTIIFEYNGSLWSIHGDDYPREHRIFNEKTMPDYQHIELRYHGKKSHHQSVIGDYEGYVTRTSRVEIFSDKTTGHVNYQPNVLAAFTLLNFAVVYVTFNGIYVKNLNEFSLDKKLKSSELITTSYSPTEIANALRNQIDIDLIKSVVNDDEAVNIMKRFLIGRISEFVRYMAMHQDEILKRFDEMVEKSQGNTEGRKTSFIKSINN